MIIYAVQTAGTVAKATLAVLPARAAALVEGVAR